MSLKTLQQEFKNAAVSDEIESFLAEHLPYGTQESQGRFSIYQNNILETLMEVLERTYEACEKVVGKDFFRQVARQFVKENLPQDPSLFKYGKEFVPFFNTIGQQHHYAYWGDIAAFEWAENDCFFAQDVHTLTLHDLKTLSEETFAKLDIRLSPAVRLLKTECNAQEIINYAKSNEGTETTGEMTVTQDPNHYLFYRTENKVISEKITPIIFGALTSLRDPITLDDLASKFTAQGCEEHFAPFIQMLFEKELICRNL